MTPPGPLLTNELSSRYLIGIDLGTTTCSCAYVDRLDQKSGYPVRYLLISQLTQPGLSQAKNALPSFVYQATPLEFPKGSLSLPWNPEDVFSITGAFAQERGSASPKRLVRSAKSWLAHPLAARKDNILPLELPPQERISPVEASRLYLSHLASAWKHSISGKDPLLALEEQEVIITVPASFDEVARSLTLESAKLAGFKQVRLLEEPQSAFYAWLSENETQLEKIFKPGDLICVCDVGGGTTDFSLIEVESKDSALSFTRKAVGEHLLLGGDNLDLAIASFIEDKIKKPLSSDQKETLIHAAKKAKEILLTTSEETTPILIQGSGSSLIGSTLSTTLSKKELIPFLLNGFFPLLPFETAKHIEKKSALQKAGLSYAQEPAITKQLAHFLEGASPGKWPTHLLFNGGSLKPALFQEALLNALKLWSKNEAIRPLVPHNLELAVAKGAAYFAKSKHGLGIKIEAGLARSYYIAIEKQGHLLQAMTLATRGTPFGTDLRLPHDFVLLPNIPVSFQLYTSNTRLGDTVGSIIDFKEEELTPLAPMQTVLRLGKRKDPIKAQLQVHLSNIGSLELELSSQETDHVWKLEFQTDSHFMNTSSESTSLQETLSEEEKKLAKSFFDDDFNSSAPQKHLQFLEDLLSKKRQDFPVSILRTFFDLFIEKAPLRYKSQEHGFRFWNRLGFFIRPGFGSNLDEWRCQKMWKLFLEEQHNKQSEPVEIQKLIALRRLAGGLKAGQQHQLIPTLLAQVLDKKGRKLLFDPLKPKEIEIERLRLLASLEYLSVEDKKLLGNVLVTFLEKQPLFLFPLSRIGARNLLYAGPGFTLPPQFIEPWLETLEKLKSSKTSLDPNDPLLFTLFKLAEKIDLEQLNVSKYWQDTYGTLSLETQASRTYSQFNDLPLGLKLC